MPVVWLTGKSRGLAGVTVWEEGPIGFDIIFDGAGITVIIAVVTLATGTTGIAIAKDELSF